MERGYQEQQVMKDNSMCFNEPVKGSFSVNDAYDNYNCGSSSREQSINEILYLREDTSGMRNI